MRIPIFLPKSSFLFLSLDIFESINPICHGYRQANVVNNLYNMLFYKHFLNTIRAKY